MFKLFFIAVAVFQIYSSAWAEGTGNFIYDSHGKRDPFVSLAGGEEKGIVATDVTGIEDISLQGVATDSKGRFVSIINSEVFKKGDKIGDVVIKEIKKDSVVVSVQGKDHILKLYE